ncbi:16S rRNA (guanine(966)-N(2))-methyltransferase RsmD [Frisingicoccus sp.]|uniref:16S rRNA (guanine(966)-N(2))-methyltransferase RsmD n=1 Tax=Frisingicoccus sp. TaxID=1918627 RepID=UPI0015B7CA9C
MRVISGSARRIQLKTVEGMGTRPTTDRIKETLFNILQPELYRARFLDLFSGSGAIGIEALSRGCGMAVFVENDREATACIRENLERTKLFETAEVMQKDVFAALETLEKEGKSFDIIFMDPPYDRLFEKKVLDRLSGSALIHEETLIVVEASLKTDFSYIEDSGYKIIREKRYKTNKHLFLTIK